ncbi:MAG: hypothetical protein P8074_05970 [Anaerolineales bacterium]
MTDQPSEALDYAQRNHDRFVEELEQFVRIPSISTDPEAKQDMPSG